MLKEHIKQTAPAAYKMLSWGYGKFRRISRSLVKFHFHTTFSYRPSDVVIVSYPKSGSTWLRFIMAHLINETIPGDPQEIDFLRVQQIVPAISLDALNKARADFESLPSPRIMRSHSLYNARCPRVIYLMRDGRDVLVSYYYHFKKLYGLECSLYEFLDGDYREMEWNDHLDSWIYQNSCLENICTVRYEDMFCDTFSEIQNLVDFIGLDQTDECIRKAVDLSRLERMRDIEEEKGLGYVQQGDAKINFVRKGGSGNWRNEFGEKEKDIFKVRYGSALIRAGYESSFQW